MPRLKENILLNFEFKNEATRANLQENKRILKWRPFCNKVYMMNNIKASDTLEHQPTVSPVLYVLAQPYP